MLIAIVDFRVSKIDAIEREKGRSGEKGREGVQEPSSIAVKRNASLEDRKAQKKKRHSHNNLWFCSVATLAL